MSFNSNSEIKAVVIGPDEIFSDTINLVLKMKWPKLALRHVTETDKGLELLRRLSPEIVFLECEDKTQGCFTIISQIRSLSNVPIIVISQSNEVIDKVRALEMGADDWISPSSVPMEFIAKVNALLRRCYPNNGNHHFCTFPFCTIRICYDSHEVFLSGTPVKFTPIESKILCQLAKHQGSIVSHIDLLLSGWGAEYEKDREFIKKYIYRLRQKIEKDPTHPEIILNSRGEGYIFADSKHSTN